MSAHAKPRPRGVFIFGVTAALLLLVDRGVAEPRDCGADRIDRWARVVHVFDGDTVELRDGQRVRLVGIDTPEMGRDGAPAEAYAAQARRALEKLLAQRRRVGLRFDRERRDRYQRVLAHLFLSDGTNLQQRKTGYGLFQGPAAEEVGGASSGGPGLAPGTWWCCVSAYTPSGRAPGNGLNMNGWGRLEPLCPLFLSGMQCQANATELFTSWPVSRIRAQE